jgi:hypothetical protein
VLELEFIQCLANPHYLNCECCGQQQRWIASLSLSLCNMQGSSCGMQAPGRAAADALQLS